MPNDEAMKNEGFDYTIRDSQGSEISPLTINKQL